jgi:aminomethyltransferase
MPLYGHELSETINPIHAGLNFAVNLDGREFLGRSALVAAKANKQLPVRIGLALSGRRVPREHYPVLAEGKPAGEVTSGTFSPTFQKPIAMAYVAPEYAAVGTQIAVDLRGTAEPATVVKLPFYTRASRSP